MKVSDILVKSLIAQGIQYVIGVPGEENADFMLSLQQTKKIKFILAHDETQAGMIGIGYSTITRVPVAVICTLGPGATNVATAVGQATQDGAALIVIVGQGSTKRLERDSHQIMNQIAFFQPIAKRVVSIREPNLVSGIVHKAVKESISGKPGSVVIELPENIAKLEGEYRYLPRASRNFNRNSYFINDLAISEAVKMISNSKNPVFVVGAGVARDDASYHLRKLIHWIYYPHQMEDKVVNTFQAKGTVVGSKTVGFMDKSGIKPILESDLVIAVGYGQVEVSAEKLGIVGKKVINISSVPASEDPLYIPDIELTGDLCDTLGRIRRALSTEKCYD
jgi:acetolactate synthase-1/2/3 large subunit